MNAPAAGQPGSESVIIFLQKNIGIFGPFM